MTGAEYDGAVKALQERADKLVADTRETLAKDAAALVGALEARAEVLARHARTSDLVASATFFKAIPVSADEGTYEPDTVGGAGRTNWSLYEHASQPRRIPPGNYTLVIALIPRAKL